jgi:hypothetical protein
MMLDQCRNDFQSLIDRIQLHAAFEKADSKDRLDFRLLLYFHIGAMFADFRIKTWQSQSLYSSHTS